MSEKQQISYLASKLLDVEYKISTVKNIRYKTALQSQHVFLEKSFNNLLPF